MGVGILISVAGISAVVVVEIMPMQRVRELNLIYKYVAVTISVLWQIPQNFLLGASKVFMFAGQVEFLYDQSLDAMRSLCTTLPLVSFALGNYLNSLILTVVIHFTTQGRKLGWILDNLNEGHLDYFFWLLAGLSFLNLLVYIVTAKNYKKKKAIAIF
ncbi:hypothetical protein HN51_058855 [Arachis hypogaea]